MVAKTNPTLDTKYGWSLGEDNWNLGMDENINKFSFLLNGQIESVVETLPEEAQGGSCYYVKGSNNLSCYLDSDWLQIGIPLWYVIKNKQTGEEYTYNGSEFVSSGRNKIGSDEILTNLKAFADQADFIKPSELETHLSKSFYITPQMFGAKGDGVSDDTAAIRLAVADGRPLYWGDTSKNYLITESITVTVKTPVFWKSSGASVTVSAQTFLQYAIQVKALGHDVHISGRFTVNCSRKSFIGVWFENSSTTEYCDLSIHNIKIIDVYRPDDRFTVGGTGLRIRGGFKNILLFKPDIRNVAMATGAGVPGFRGVSGITITALTLGPQEVTVFHPYVDGVYSEDTTYTMDQDGLAIFAKEDDGTAELHSSHFSVIGGKFKNCGGRSIKSQMEFGQITGTHFERNDEISSITRRGDMPEIDFQTGGGLIQNIECNYVGSAPDRVIQLTGSRQANPMRYNGGAKVDGVRISRVGGNTLGSVVDIATEYTRVGMYDLRNITQTDSGTLTRNAINVSGKASNVGIFIFNIENFYARVPTGSSFFRTTRPSGTTHVVGRNLYSSQSSTTFATNAGAGSMTTKLEGINVNIV